MALNDIQQYDAPTFGAAGADSWIVAPSSTIIYPGEPVVKSLGAYFVSSLLNGTPSSVTTDSVVGIAVSQSNNTASASGTVLVQKIVSGASYLIAPKTAATWNTQTKYNMLIGHRVTFDVTSGTYTLNATDGASNGLIVLPLDIAKFPGKVRFAFRSSTIFLA